MANRALVAGTAQGEVLVLDESLSFWGGLEPTTGEIIDRRHPQSGAILSGKVLLMRAGRGSSSGSSVLAEAIRFIRTGACSPPTATGDALQSRPAPLRATGWQALLNAY